MKCLNCNQENKPDALFCSSCGNKLTVNENEEIKDENSINREHNISNNINNYNTQNKKPKNNIWLIIGIVVAVIVALIFIGSLGNNNNSDNSIYIQSTNDRTKLENYLTSIGFNKQSSTKYTFYKDGYTYTFDFSESIFSQQGDTMYNAYYYKQDLFGTAMVSDSFKVVATYTLNTYSYNCETEPVTYQSYACSYMKSTIIDLAETMKKTFYTFTNSAGVTSIYNL